MIKGQGVLNNFIAKKIAKKNRDSIIQNFNWELIDSHVFFGKKSDVKIFSFSGSNYFQEQFFSIVKYVLNVGVPNHWYVVNDGTYTREQIDILQRFSFVDVVEFDWVKNDRFKLLLEFTHEHVWAKIFYAYFNFLDNISGTMIYLEADVLVFDKYNYYKHLFKNGNWYLADTGPHHDVNYSQNNEMAMFDVNNGFAIYNSRPPIEIAYLYLTSRFLHGDFEYFTPQGAMQLMIKEDKLANFLDPRFFVVTCSDQFKITKDFRAEDIALRHFVGPVRHKMWQYA